MLVSPHRQASKMASWMKTYCSFIWRKEKTRVGEDQDGGLGKRKLGFCTSFTCLEQQRTALPLGIKLLEEHNPSAPVTKMYVLDTGESVVLEVIGAIEIQKVNWNLHKRRMGRGKS